MTRSSSVIAVLAILPCCVSCFAANAVAWDTNTSPTPAQQALDRLIVVRQFALGGVGIAGTTSEGEKAYRIVLACTNAPVLFQSVLARGSNEAKLYALAGLRHLERKSFDAAAKALLAANPEVRTMSGCMVDHEKAEAVVKRIASGFYDHRTDKSEATIRRR
jgi:hypothetical protein